jgi:hypothetical protein
MYRKADAQRAKLQWLKLTNYPRQICRCHTSRPEQSGFLTALPDQTRIEKPPHAGYQPLCFERI